MYSLVASGCLLSLTVLLATSYAYPYKNNYHETRDNYDPKDVRNLDGIGGGNLLRDLDILRNRASLYERQARNFDNLDSLAGITLGSQKRSWDPFTGAGKRNMDEIDHAGFDSFVKKRGFDEIDNVGFDGFVKRNLDEIDRVGFGTFIKRNAPAYPTTGPHK